MQNLMPDLNLPPRILLGPGPSNVHPRVIKAVTASLLGHMDPEFFPVLDSIRDMLKQVFRASKGITLVLPATGMAGMEAAFVNVIEPGDKVLVVTNGFFGSRMADIASRCGAQVSRVDVPWGKPVLPEHVEKGLKSAGKVKAVAVVYAETSTGVRSPLRDVARVVHAHDALLISDAVTALGGIELDVDTWGLDVCYSGSQKCLGAPPGLSPITFGPRAVAAIKARKTKVQSFYFDVTLLEDYWSSTRAYHHTTPVLMMYAFYEALRIVLEEGLEERWRRHARVAGALRAGLEALGLKLFAEPGYRLNPLTTVLVPPGVEDARVRKQLLAEHSIEIGGGLGELRGKLWRIGLMGYSCSEANVFTLLSALERILPQHSYELARGAGVEAAQRALVGHDEGL